MPGSLSSASCNTLCGGWMGCLKILNNPPSSLLPYFTINHHQPPPTTINHHQPPSTTTNHHKLPSTTTTNHHKPLSTTINRFFSSMVEVRWLMFFLTSAALFASLFSVLTSKSNSPCASWYCVVLLKYCVVLLKKCVVVVVLLLLCC